MKIVLITAQLRNNFVTLIDNSHSYFEEIMASDS